MTIKQYLMINKSTNVVENICMWDGNTETWQPPEEYIMLVDEETEALVWVLSEDQLSMVLAPVLGAGSIGFTWDGTILTTNEPDPNPLPINEPILNTNESNPLPSNT